ncbi:hypothetical protein [Streptomyces sp. CNQ-509]|nr:hypothetical protein [Streptomyces sp. CNQ-509]
MPSRLSSGSWPTVISLPSIAVARDEVDGLVREPVGEVLAGGAGR